MDVPDHATCYRTICRRDARFDGRFYTAVTTTGIFCRPSCPARTPKSSNVRFYAHAAAASEAGFRPCRRCRPELAPGHPEWNRRADLAGQALKLIEAGAVDQVGVKGLASQLGVSERHLRRELNEAVGTGPLQLARARRLWLARLLLDQTNLSVTDVAFASGFGSVRQFNDSIRRAFDAPPSALRRRVDTNRVASSVQLRLPTRGPLRWEALHGFLAMRAIPGLESAGDSPTGRNVFRRNVPGGWIELSGDHSGSPSADDTEALSVTCSLDNLSDLADLLPAIRLVADLDTELEPIEAHLGRDPDLAERLALRPAARLPGTFDRFELGVRAIVGQQVSVAGARTLLGRLVELAEPAESRFPTPDEILAAPLDELGMPSRRRETIRALAQAVLDGSVVLDAHADPAECRRQLVAVPGIGPWTAGYIAMRALNDPDGWPEGDLGLRRSLGITAAELEARAARWQPWRAYAALLLWNTDPTTTPTATSTTAPTARKTS